MYSSGETLVIIMWVSKMMKPEKRFYRQKCINTCYFYSFTWKQNGSSDSHRGLCDFTSNENLEEPTKNQNPESWQKPERKNFKLNSFLVSGCFAFLPSSPAGKVPFGLKGVSSEPDHNCRGQKECLENDGDIVEADNHANSEGFNHGLKFKMVIFIL